MIWGDAGTAEVSSLPSRDCQPGPGGLTASDARPRAGSLPSSISEAHCIALDNAAVQRTRQLHRVIHCERKWALTNCLLLRSLFFMNFLVL